MTLQRSISSLSLLFAAIGGIIGSGWLFGSFYASQVAGPAAIFSWIIGGILMMFIALTFAELATTFPLAGGMVRFAEMSHGPLMSYTIGWMVWLSSVVVAPVETLALIQYAANYIPDLMQKINDTHVLTAHGFLVAIFLMAIMTVLNFQGAKFFSRTSTAIVTIKLIVPILTLLALLIFDFHKTNFTSHNFLPFGWKGVFAALPLGGVIFSFIGYSPAIQLAGEARNPQRAIPIAIIGALAFCIFLYVLLQIAFIAALKPEFIANGWNHLSFKGDTGPFAGILAALGMYWLVLIIYGDAFVSPFGTAYIYTASTARVSYAMSEIGFFPKQWQKLNKKGVPVIGLFVNYCVGLLLFLPFPGWQSMVTFIISCFVISYSIGPLALAVLRHSHGKHQRSFKLPFVKVFAPIAFYVCNLLIYWTGWQTISKLLIALSIGALVFIYRYVFSKDMKANMHWNSSWWLVPYLIGIGIISYLGSFGDGRNLISFGLDFWIIAIFTLIIYFIAIKSAKLKA